MTLLAGACHMTRLVELLYDIYIYICSVSHDTFSGHVCNSSEICSEMQSNSLQTFKFSSFLHDLFMQHLPIYCNTSKCTLVFIDIIRL